MVWLTLQRVWCRKWKPHSWSCECGRETKEGDPVYVPIPVPVYDLVASVYVGPQDEP